MFCIVIVPSTPDAAERVHIARLGGNLRLNLASRESAADWLTLQGCCPGAAAMLHDALPWEPYTIAEPQDPPALPGSLLTTT